MTAHSTSPASRHPAPGPDCLAEGHPLLPRGRPRRRPRPQAPAQPSRQSLLPGGQPGRHGHRGAGAGPAPSTSRRQGLPRRPLQRRPAQPGRRHPRRRRSLRPRQRRRPDRAPRRSRDRPDHAPSPTRCRQILHGIPLDIRDVRVDLDRPASPSTRPTASRIGGRPPAYLGHEGGLGRPPPTASRSADCAKLGFKPKLSLRLYGRHQTRRPPGADARCFSRARATPTSAASRSPCRTRSSSTRPTSGRSAPGSQFAADACPAGSIYG